MFHLRKIMKVTKSVGECVNRKLSVQRTISCNDRNNYENAIEALNNLQTNASVLQNAIAANLSHQSTYAKDRFQLTYKYLCRSGLSVDELDALSVIHVSGTKGKGSTCAFVESILRNHGYRTGFYSSPHLVSVRERIRVNGEPIAENLFTDYFWRVYEKLQALKDDPNDLPPYFKFLTIMAFNVFVREKVDVAIVEVGIGGEYDCTNIVRRVPVVGVASLGLDHTSILGNTIEEIAWQKSGIMKKDSQVFTIAQNDPDAYEVLVNRSIEKQCHLQVVPCYKDYIWLGGKAPDFGENWEIQEMNASLAIQLAHAWIYLNKNGNCTGRILPTVLEIPEETGKGLRECRWAGRFQIVESKLIRFFLDGAHTEESILYCRNWFSKSCHPSDDKVLIFNTTANRESSHFLKILSTCHFNHVYFTPNLAYKTNEKSSDQKNMGVTDNQQIKRCYEHKNIWMKLIESESLVGGHQNNNKNFDVNVFPCAYSIYEHLSKTNKPYRVLVTGSLHLVGAFLRVLDGNNTL